MAEAFGGSYSPPSWSPGHEYPSSWSPRLCFADDADSDEYRPEQTRFARASSEERRVDHPPLLDPMQIPWYHPHITRNLAEAELQRAEEGVYLMRPRFNQHTKSLKGFAIDVRATHSVKHFQVNLNPGGLWTFGQEIFTSIPSFLEHFDNRPLLGDEGGRLIVLKYPYPREVEENPDYHSSFTAHFLADPPKDKRKRMRRYQSESDVLSSSPANHSSLSTGKSATVPTDTTSIHSLSLASKAGYLMKMGGKIKSWKKRWFVLKNTTFSYYTKDTDTRPLRVIDLSQAVSVSLSEEYAEKPHLFK
jgi:hypothetical protein